MSIHLQRSVLIQPRTSDLMFIALVVSRDFILTDRPHPRQVLAGPGALQDAHGRVTAPLGAAAAPLKAWAILVALAAAGAAAGTRGRREGDGRRVGSSTGEAGGSSAGVGPRVGAGVGAAALSHAVHTDAGGKITTSDRKSAAI